MEHELVSHATLVVERLYPDSPPARVFAAYADREAKARWSTGPKHWRPELDLDFRVGGRERYRGWPPDRSVHAIDAWYLDIDPDRRIVYAYDVRVGDARLVASLATVELRPEGGGTRRCSPSRAPSSAATTPRCSSNTCTTRWNRWRPRCASQA